MSYKERWVLLKTVLDYSGLTAHIRAVAEYTDLLNEAKQQVSLLEDSKTGKKFDMDGILYFSYLKTARIICRRDFNWFMRCTTNPKKILYFHEVKENFLKYGRDALPDSYKIAERSGAIFQWYPDANITLIMYPRGIGKSTNESNGRPLYDFVNNPHEKALVLHGDKDKVVTLISGIANIMRSPGAAALYPEFFSTEKEFFKQVGTRIVAEKINIKMNPEYGTPTFNAEASIRREATFTTGSPQIDRTGFHFEKVYFDDLVGDINSKTREKQLDLISYFDSISGLEEYRDGAPMNYHGVGTRWRGPGLYQHIIDNKRSNVFQMPLTWDDDPTISYHYHKHKVADWITTEFIDRKKSEYGEWFESQMYMKEVPFDAEVSFDFSRGSIFAFSDESADFVKIGATRDYLCGHSCVIVSKDASYSIKDKNKPGASLDTTITIGVFDDTFLVFDEFQQAGGDLESTSCAATLYAPVLDQILRNKADVYAQDVYSYQSVLFNIFWEKLAEDVPWPLIPLKYSKKSAFGNLGKNERALAVLGELFRQGRIKVHHNCSKTIAQICRNNVGMDIIDTLVNVCSTDISVFKMMANGKGVKKFDTIKKKSYNNKRVHFTTTGYKR